MMAWLGMIRAGMPYSLSGIWSKKIRLLSELEPPDSKTVLATRHVRPVNPAQLCNKLSFLYIPTIMLDSEIHCYCLYLYFFFGVLPDHDLPCFFLLPVIPMPCSCAQIYHIEQYGGIIPHFFFTSIPQLSNRAFFLRIFFPEFFLGLCCRTSLLHAQTVYATCFCFHNFVFCLPTVCTCFI
jgi:hypothetical protein